ncbi:hypothetical protein PspLS_00940 [Pyricularia sp. CBS 133598]|nr:hypothetical protein PspLS_00940 [Pyricularia sp. CBS 133598]
MSLSVGSTAGGDGPQSKMVGVGTKHTGTLRSTVVALVSEPC